MVEATLPRALAQRFDIHPLKAVVKSRKKPRFVRQNSNSQCILQKHFLKCKCVAKPNSIAAEDCPNLVKFFWAGNASEEQNQSHILKRMNHGPQNGCTNTEWNYINYIYIHRYLYEQLRGPLVFQF